MSQIVFLAFAMVIVTSAAAFAADNAADGVMKEYSAARAAGLARLDVPFVQRLEALKRKHVQGADLGGATAIDQAVKSLTSGAAGADVPIDKALPADAAAILRERAADSQRGLMKLNQIYAGKMQATKAAALKSGDLAGANAASTRLVELSEELKVLTPGRPADPSAQAKDETTVEAYIDGNTELHVSKQGLFWKVVGGESKPGRNDDKNFPCYVDSRKWQPEWKNKSTDRGPDTSEVYPLSTAFPNLTAEKVSVSEERFGRNEPKHTGITYASQGGDFVVTIPDPEAGAYWYKIKIKAVKR